MRGFLLGILHPLVEHTRHARYRLLHAKPDHVWLASFPRSGSTWLRRMLHDILIAPRLAAPPMREGIPDLHKSMARIGRMPERFIKTHYRFHPCYRRVVLLVRHPLGCLPSYARYVGAPSLDEFVPRSLAGHGPYGSWAEHARSYLDSGLDERHLLVIRYEDLLADAAEAVHRVLSFSGASASAGLVRAVADRHRRGSATRHEIPPAVRDTILGSDAGVVAARLGYGDPQVGAAA